MTTTVASVIASAQVLLQEAGAGVRHPAATELLAWANAGQREAVMVNPAVYTQTKAVQLAAGARQSLGAGATQDAWLLLSINCNMGTDGETEGPAVSIVPRELLDAQDASWRASTQDAEVEHYVYDPRTPLRYYVSPPNDGTGYVEVTYSAIPPAMGAGDNIALPDILANALVDYILYRAFSKDGKETLYERQASAHFALFKGALEAYGQSVLSHNQNVDPAPMNPASPASAQ